MKKEGIPLSIVLASQSPRRQALLRQIGLPFRVLAPKGEEKTDLPLPPGELVQQLSKQKAQEVAKQAAPGDLILAADTMVVLDALPLGKPKTEAEAKQMLQMLSGRTHLVYTGICLLRGDHCVTDTMEASVTFRSLSDLEIGAYVQTGEPMDKAGAYGIQGKGALFVSRIEGDFYTVMGLPLCRLAELLPKFGYFPFGSTLEGEKEGLT